MYLQSSRYPPLILSFLATPPPPRSTLFPYTTLFRSEVAAILDLRDGIEARQVDVFALLGGEFRAQQEILRQGAQTQDRKSTRLNSSHRCISYAVFCLKKKKQRSRRASCATGSALQPR